MIIDGHMHCPDGGDVKALLETYDKVGIEMGAMLATPPIYGHGDNDTVERIVREHPDRFVAMGFVDLDRDTPDMVGELADRGFIGLKLISPRQNYDSAAYFPFYQRAVERDLCMLFHTGIVAATGEDSAWGVSSARMRPIYLDTIGRAFPDARIVGAHLGDPWMSEACETARWVANVHFDLSGLMYPTLATREFQTLIWRNQTKDFFAQHYVTDLYDKVFFGTDVPVVDIPWIVRSFLDMLDALGLDDATRRKLLSDNARAFYRI